MPVDLSVAATCLLLLLVLVYGAALGALVMWLGQTGEPAAVTATAE